MSTVLNEERYFVSTDIPDTNYILPADQREKERLELQHRWLKEVFNGKIILAPVDFSGAASVLDAGTGTGVWILEAAQKLPPSTKFHGIDIQTRLFPTVQPEDDERLKFSFNSITDLPEEWSESFDLVNQRLLLGAFQYPQWQAAIRGIHRVLKPGGWVQFCEIGHWAEKGPLLQQLDEAVTKLFQKRGLLKDCAADIQEIVKGVGFVNVHLEKKIAPFGGWAGQLGLDGRANMIEYCIAMKTPFLKGGLSDFAKTEAEYDSYVDRLTAELGETPGCGIEASWIYAQKPE